MVEGVRTTMKRDVCTEDAVTQGTDFWQQQAVVWKKRAKDMGVPNRRHGGAMWLAALNPVTWRLWHRRQPSLDDAVTMTFPCHGRISIKRKPARQMQERLFANLLNIRTQS